MVSAKDIRVAPIKPADANKLVQRLHYSGKVVRNSQLHFGVFLAGRLEGVMQFGPSLDKRKIQGLVKNTLWSGFIELNRMAFSEALPRNSESRAIAIAMRLIKKAYPHIEWVVSFADGTQCGDGAIYRASGFFLTGITPSVNLVRRADGVVVHKMTLESNPTTPRRELGGKSYFSITGGKYNLAAYAQAVGGKTLPGYQLRYIYFLNAAAQDRLTVPVLPFSTIDEIGAGMYRGKKKLRAGSIDSDASTDLVEKGGASPTSALHFEVDDAG